MEKLHRSSYRGNWKIDWKRKKKILDQTRGLITENELAEEFLQKN